MSLPAVRWYGMLARAAATTVAAVLVLALVLVPVLAVPGTAIVPSSWPAAGVAVAAVALSGGRRRVAAAAAAGLLTVPVALLAGCSPGVAACLGVAGALEAALTGWWLGRRGELTLRTLPDLGWLSVAAAAGAVLAGGVVAAGTALLPVEPGWAPWWTVWWMVTASHAAAVVVLVPLVMRLPVNRAPAGSAELAAWWVVVLGTVLLVFAPGQVLPLVFLPEAVLVGAGLRAGIRVVSVQLVMVAAVVVALTATGAGPFAAVADLVGPGGSDALAQAFLGGCALVVFAATLSVAQRDAALVELADQRRFDRAVLEVVDAAVVACAADGTVVLDNAAHRRMVGDDEPGRAVELGGRVRLLEDGVVVPASRSPLRRALNGEEVQGVHMQIGQEGGDLYEIVVTARPIRGADGRLLGAVSAFTDVTAERAVQARLRESMAFQDAILAAIPDDIYLLDITTLETLWASRSLDGRLGYRPGEVRARGRGILEAVVHPDDAVQVRASYVAAVHLADGEVQSLRVRVRTRDGQYRWLSRRVTPFARGPDGRVRQVIGVRHAEELVEAEQLLEEAALHDPLTGLPNRRLLGDRLDAALAEAAATGRQVAVLFCDLDGFKNVNDTGGHAAGDALLRATAERLQAVLRPEDTVARVGGDEFVVVLASAITAREDSALCRSALAVTRRILRSLAGPIEVGGRSHAVTVSVGITFAGPGDTAEQTLRAADTAMYRAKTQGKNRYEVFDRGRSLRRARGISGA